MGNVWTSRRTYVSLVAYLLKLTALCTLESRLSSTPAVTWLSVGTRTRRLNAQAIRTATDVATPTTMYNSVCNKFLKQLQANVVWPNTNRTQAAKGRKMFFVPGDLDLWPLISTFKLVRAKDQTRLPCEFGANPFSGSRNISYTNKNTDWRR